MIIEICDAGHSDSGSPVVLGRRGGMVVNLETKATLCQRESNICCLDLSVHSLHTF